MYAEERTATERDRYGYEQGLDRMVDQRQRLEHQIGRLINVLGPVLENEVPQIDKNGGATPGYPSTLLADINRHADLFAVVADKLESVIGRIRL